MECKEKNWGSVCTYQIFPIDRAVVQGARKQLTSGFFYKRREVRLGTVSWQVKEGTTGAGWLLYLKLTTLAASCETEM